jgi:RNA polymerase sigma-70 factor, ECF subfamily
MKTTETRSRGNTSAGEKFDEAIHDGEVHQLPKAGRDVAEIFSEHAEFVWRSLKRLKIPVLDIDDALQEVFLVVYRRIEEYEDRGMMRAWLFSISRQIARHYHRAATRTERRLQRLVLEENPPNAEHVMALREAEDLVTKFLDELDENHRLVFHLSDIEGMTAPEISTALGVNLNTVYGRLRSARKRFERTVALRAEQETTER